MTDEISMEFDELSKRVIGATIEVHRILGAGLIVELKSAAELLPIYQAQILT